MLDRKEKIVMGFLFEKCGAKPCLIPSTSIIKYLSEKKYVISLNELQQIMNSLSKDGMIDYVESESKNGLVYCVSLKNKGALFKKDQQKERRHASWVILRTALLAIFSFAIGLLLRVIFD